VHKIAYLFSAKIYMCTSRQHSLLAKIYIVVLQKNAIRENRD
jgi:hypothetical protein